MITVNVNDEENGPIFSIIKDDKILFAVKSDGSLSYMIDGDLKEFTDEKEFSLMFRLLFSQIYTNSGLLDDTLDRDSLVRSILKNHRERTLDKML